MYTTAPMTYSFLPLETFTPAVDSIRAAATAMTVDAVSIESPRSLKLLQTWMKDPRIFQLEMILFSQFMPTPAQAAPKAGKSYFSLSLVLCHPFSRGSVHITSADPTANPAIDLGVFESPVDLEIMAESIRFARRIIRTDTMVSINTHEVAPGSNVQSDDEIKEYVKNSVVTVFHPIGTCSLLPRHENGVVGDDFKVYGSANLRVVCTVYSRCSCGVR